MFASTSSEHEGFLTTQTCCTVFACVFSVCYNEVPVPLVTKWWCWVARAHSASDRNLMRISIRKSLYCMCDSLVQTIKKEFWNFEQSNGQSKFWENLQFLEIPQNDIHTLTFINLPFTPL